MEVEVSEMKFPQKQFHLIMQGHVLKALAKLPSDSIDCVVTSPPYWGLRDYKIEPTVWDGVEGCEHEWSEYQKEVERGKVRWSDAYGGNGQNRYVNMGGDASKNVEAAREFVKITNGFCSKCSAWKGQLGLEPTFQLYVQHIVGVFHEVKRVLKPTGALWLNLGDTYNSANNNWKNAGPRPNDGPKADEVREALSPIYAKSLPEKCLIGIPYRVMLAMMDDGWILRNVNVWAKPNHMPSSVKDRFSNGWEPVFFFVKEPKYWFDLDAVRIPHEGGLPAKFNIRVRDVKEGRIKHTDRVASEAEVLAYDEKAMNASVRSKTSDESYKNLGRMRNAPEPSEDGAFHPAGKNPGDTWKRLDPDEIKQGEHSLNKRGHSGYFDDEGNLLVNPLGTNPGDYWEVTTQPFPDAHFATFPEALVERPLKASCPAEVCPKCGKARERIIDVEYVKNRPSAGNDPRSRDEDREAEAREFFGSQGWRGNNLLRSSTTKGWTSCSCSTGFIPGIVLDPFAGSGTVALVAKQNQRSSVSIEIKPEYVAMLKNRIDFGHETIDGGIEWMEMSA